MEKLDSSWRDVAPDDTLQIAKHCAPLLGISRVTDVTRLDRIGIPVYSSIRPDALRSSLCVNAGKGLKSVDAMVGAYMEAIEFAWAEPRRAFVKRIETSPEEVSSQCNFASQFVSLCPVLGTEVVPDGLIEGTIAQDFHSGSDVIIPLELVLSPIEDLKGQSIFGTSTNGLSSGNSLHEAVLHGICEVIERDVQAFNFFCDESVSVDVCAGPDALVSLAEQILNAGMQLSLRYTPNQFGLPFMQAYILAPDSDPIRVSHGTGLHLSSKVAAVRAITEAAQSRLSYIHGGRDDLTVRKEYFEKAPEGTERSATEKLIKKAFNQKNSIQFEEINSFKLASISDALQTLRNILTSQGMDQVLVVQLSPDDFPLAVVKTIVPKLESFSPRLKRFGPRLKEFVRAIPDERFS